MEGLFGQDDADVQRARQELGALNTESPTS
jgi:hypothetical protein